MKFWLKLPIYVVGMLVGVFVLAVYLAVSSVAMFILRKEGRDA